MKFILLTQKQLGQGMLVREAIRLQTDGHSLGEVVAYLEEQK